jgi:predicted Zn-dependent peptidase
MRHAFFLPLIGALLLLAAAPSSAQDETWLAQQLEPVFHAPPADVEVLRLDNGLQVVLMPNPAQPMVGIYTQVRVGSAYEDFATSGMTHMLEHLLFNGSEKYTQEELYAAADRAGAYNNAHTTDFYTDFMMVLPADRLETGLDLQSQMLFHSLLPEDKFPKEQGIVLGELAQARDRGDTFADEALRDALYGDTSLALPALGTTATIANLQRDDVWEFYRSWYVPNNMILTMAGRFDRDEALELLRRYYGEVAPRPLPAHELDLAPHLERTRTIVRRGGGRRVLNLAFEAPVYGDQDRVAFEVAAELLTADGSGILTRALEDLPEGGRPDLSSWWQPAPGFGRYVLELDLPETADPDGYYRWIQDAVIGALELGIPAEALTEVQAMARTRTLKEREQLRMTGIYISGPLVLGGPDALLGYLGELATVTPADVERALRTWLIDRPCLALLVEPASRPMPADAGEAPASGGSIERTVLPEGAVLVSQTSPGSELMAVHLTVRSRALLDQRNGHPGALNLVHRMLDTGISGCDASCLAQRLRRLGAQVKWLDDPRFPMDDYYTNGRFSFVRVECPAENGPEVLELLAEVARFSTFTGDDLARERQEQLDLLQRRQTTARWQASRLLAEGLYGDHPLALPAEGTVETVEAVTYDEVRSLYRKAFQPENLILAIVSPYGHDELVAMMPNWADSGGESAPTLPPLPTTTAPERRTATLEGPLASIRLGSIRPVDPGDEAALELLIAVLSDRLVMDLRETRGLSYSVGASIRVDGSQGVFSAWLNPPTPRLAEGEQALGEALRAFDPASITQEELDTVRAARQGRLMMRRLDSISRAYYLAMAELGGDLSHYLQEIPAYDDVTLEDLQRVAGFFSELPLVTVVVD